MQGEQIINLLLCSKLSDTKFYSRTSMMPKIIDLQSLVELIELYSNASGFPVAVLSMDGKPLASANMPAFCKLSGAKQAVCVGCQVFDNLMMADFTENGFIKIFCDKSIEHTVLPIEIEAQQTAYFVFSYKTKTADFSETHSQDAEQYGLPVLSAERIDHIIKFFRYKASFISNIGHYKRELDSKYVELEQAKHELDENQKFLNNTFKNIPVGIYTKETGKDFRYLLWNKAMEYIIGIPHEKIIGKTDFDCFSAEEAQQLRNLDLEILNTRKSIQIQEKLSVLGNVRIIDTLKIPIFDNNDQPYAILGIVQDITTQKNAEAALYQSKLLNHSILSVIPDTILISDKNGYIIDIHAPNQDIITISDLDKRAKKIFDLIPYELSGRIEKLMLIAAKINEIQQVEFEKNVRGNNYYFEARIICTPDEKFITIIQDVTDRKAAEYAMKNSEERFRTLAENSQDIIIRFDKSRRINYLNAKTLREFNLASEGIIGRTLQELSESTALLEVDTAIQEIIETGKHINLQVELNYDKQTLYLDLQLTPELDDHNEVSTILGVARDITSLKNAALELTKAKEAAEVSDKLKSSFLANMSHEIRTPMNAILGFARLLKNDHLTKEKKDQYVTIINRSTNQLLSIINDVIDISKIEAGSVELLETTVHLNNLFSEMLMMFHTDSLRKNSINIFIHKGLSNEQSTIITDEVKLRQILSNLITNALKYTNHGKVEFGYKLKQTELQASPQLKDFRHPVDTNNSTLVIEFYVKDTGIGIPEDKWDSIFNRFTRLEMPSNLKVQGTGLGLSISKAYIKFLGGEIWVESKMNIGSTFYFTIPYKPVKKNEQRLTNTSNTEYTDYNWTSFTILVAEDDDTNYKYINELLIETGATVIRAKNGREAFQICQTDTSVNLVLMDVKMPVMNGLESARSIRHNSATLPIIALTAFAMSDDEKQAMEAGCNGYISKPINENKLLSMINTFLKHHNKV